MTIIPPGPVAACGEHKLLSTNAVAIATCCERWFRNVKLDYLCSNRRNKNSWRVRPIMLAPNIALLIASLASSVTQGPKRSVEARPPEISVPSPVADSAFAKEQEQRQTLELDKLRLETDKLRIENANSEHTLFSWRGWMNLLYGNGSVIVAAVLGFWGLYRYLQDRRAELRKREEERFEGIVKSLGAGNEQERISAAISLQTFLGKDYQRFYAQVFNLATGHLRMALDDERAKYSPLPSPLLQILATVFRDSYPLARNVLFGEPEENKDVATGRELNAAGVHLDGTYLAKADLRRAWLREASFRKTTLKAASLINANLEKCSMAEASLEEADLGGEESNLMNADFSRAHLDAAVFDGANLEGASLNSTCADNASFRETRMKNTKIIDGTAIGADFSDADLTQAEFTGVNFAPTQENAKAANPEAAKNLTGTIFKNVKGLTQEQITQCKNKGAIFV